MLRVFIVAATVLISAPTWGQVNDYRADSRGHNLAERRWETTLRELDREQRERELEDRLRLRSPEALQEYQDWKSRERMRDTLDSFGRTD